ncbi:MAG: UDP-N-acetyl-D-mannosamine dehydrogenase [Candidatus Omnitrophica bacterium]|nr:UDP-N-acetyl-D-mannosamine dehydrogenase [Candidatus Omnitrophota bacterium]
MTIEKKTVKVCVIGLGYIGLPTAALLASFGYKVVGVDINKNVVDTINKGKIHIKEPDLNILVAAAVNSGNLIAKLRPEPADIFIISVPTPFKYNKNKNIKPDLSYVRSAVLSIVPHLKKDNLVILESTSPVGTTENVVARIIRDRSGMEIGKEIFVAYSPERVLPGKILTELIMNDRVIGGINNLSAERAKGFYSQFVKGSIYLTDSKTAEIVKLVENSFRDVNIAFANEISMIADKIGINVWELVELVNKHPRVKMLKPGPGVGGHCIAVDPWFLISQFNKEAKLLRSAREVNNGKTKYVLNKIINYAKSNGIENIGCLGLTYKENIDDTRESPALDIVKELISSKAANIFVCDPYVDQEKIKNIQLFDLNSTLQKSELIVILVAHKEFVEIERKKLINKKILDFRGVIT